MHRLGRLLLDVIYTSMGTGGSTQIYILQCTRASSVVSGLWPLARGLLATRCRPLQDAGLLAGGLQRVAWCTTCAIFDEVGKVKMELKKTSLLEVWYVLTSVIV